MSPLQRKLLEIRSVGLKPAPRLSLVEWADTYRYLSPESSSTPGKWNTNLVEAARGPMLSVTEPGVKKITVMGPTQLLKTEFINNVVGYFISQDPAPIIVMQPIEKLGETWATDRLDPMIRDTPILNGLIADKRTRDSGNTKLHKIFPGGHITVVSAGSPSDVASRPVRVVLMDEVDKYKSSGSEGDAEKLIEQRTETFWNALSIAVCSPTNEGTSKIAARFEESDQRLFHGRCPHCGELEHLVWSQVKWYDNDPQTTHYECSKCLTPWSETERLHAVANGEYIATRPFNGHAGFHVNAIASPWQPLSRLVEKFLESQKDQEKLKVFINTSLAETWKPKADVPDYMRLYERREPYQVGFIPREKGIRFLTMGVDVQADRLEAQVIGWTRDKQSFSIDYRVILGMTHTDGPWDELYQLINRHYQFEDTTQTMHISFACVDSGFNSPKVYDFVSRFSPNKVRAIKGSDSLPNIYKMGSDLTFNFNGSKNRFAHKLWMVGSSFLKEDLYSKLRLAGAGDSGLFPPGFCHFPSYDEEFFKGLTAEALIVTKKSGKTVYAWEKQRARNEPLDTFNYARAAASMFGLDRFTELEWQQLEAISLSNQNNVQNSSTPSVNTPVLKPNNTKPQGPPSGLWRNPGLRNRRF